MNSVPDWPWEQNIPVPVCAGAPFWGYAPDIYIHTLVYTLAFIYIKIVSIVILTYNNFSKYK